MESGHDARIRATIHEFEKRRRRQLILLVPTVAALLAMFVGSETDFFDRIGIAAGALLPAFFILIAVLVGFSLYNWRCPACRSYLGRSLRIRYCRRCGAQLRM